MRNKHPSATAARESRRGKMRSEEDFCVTGGQAAEIAGVGSIVDKVGKEVSEVSIIPARYCLNVTICMIHFCDP